MAAMCRQKTGAGVLAEGVLAAVTVDGKKSTHVFRIYR
jgi:hypothetical protein